MSKSKKVVVQGTQIRVLIREGDDDFISLTDMAKKFGDDVLIYQWMRNRNTVEFLGIWEQLHNSDFKGLEFETFKKQAGSCKFSDCRHEHETGCAVLSALKSGQLKEEQYSNFIKLKKESAHYAMSGLEKRQKDKRFGKMVKTVKQIKGIK